MLRIIQADTEERIADARELFLEYEEWLGLSLCFQGFEAELANLPGKYAGADGRLLLATVGEDAAGCIALRKLEDDICEMKRLFVRDAFRGQGIGQRLIERVIEEARAIGYGRMRLDTLPAKVGKAVGLYRAYGFREIGAYYENPHEGTVFMELGL